MREAKHNNESDRAGLTEELIRLCDDLADFQCLNSFLCRSFTSEMSCDEPVAQEVIDGAKLCVEVIDGRMWKLKRDLRDIQERYAPPGKK